MATAWPQRELSKPERDLWMRDLEPRHFVAAMEAIDACRGSYDWLPTFHQFREAYDGIRRREDEYRSMRAIAPPQSHPDDVERAQRDIAGLGRPSESTASPAYSGVWSAHLRGAMSRIGRIPA